MNAPLRLQPSETPVLFGPEGRLMGLVTPPVPGSDRRVGCLLLNFGVLHRIGPHRLNVKVARELAKQGVTSLRFDLSGQGDSGSSRSQSHHLDQSVADLRAAMDHLQSTTGIDRFVVFGICSGAANAFALSLVDERVVGLMMFDGYTYESLWSILMRDWQRMRAAPWLAVAAKAFRTARRVMAGKSARPGGIFEDGNTKPSLRDYARSMTQLIDRGVNVYLVFSASLRPYDDNRAQLSAFGKASFINRLRYEFMGDVDHFVTQLSAQRKLCNAVSDWVRRTLDGAPRTRA